ncbi:MAG: hypothetical protein U9R43_13740, partial [Thermodesulfobacteriota bacterium]|nr:hypothetical protein [Thermodesulfobacteriota bacterium]
MIRWKYKLFLIIFLGSFLFLGSMSRNADASSIFGKDKKTPRAIVVFVDMSGSTNKARRTVYRKAFDKIYQNLRQGDRIVVGTITSHSYIDFKPVTDAEIPKQSLWDNRLQYEQNLAKTKKNVREAVDRLLARKKGTPYTEILNSLNVVDTILHKEKRNKILVILSDMIQDSKQYKFGRHKITNKYISNVIRNQKEQNLVPNLVDVKIYVAGASAPNSKKFRSIQKFWSRYFKESKADFS